MCLYYEEVFASSTSLWAGVLWQSKADSLCEVLAAMCSDLVLCEASEEQPFCGRNWAESELV